MGRFESLSGDGKADAKTTLFELLQGTVEKDEMSEAVTTARTYLAMHSHLTAHDIKCVKAGVMTYIFLPQGTSISEEDKSNMHVETFAQAVGGYDVYVEI